jgi:predicted nuclease of restriction endonuclease-like (RecB) superfamily
MDDNSLAVPTEYGPFLEDLKARIRLAQVKAALAVNSELVLLYWNIGRRIAAAQETEGYGTKIVPKLSADLTRAFPDMKGFSPRNLDYMLAFARAWPDEEVLQQVVAKLPWGHNIQLLSH